MPKRILCKFFGQGACLKGDNCEYSHDWRDESNQVCTFYQKGACSYGSRCRYQHLKASRSQKPLSSTSAVTPQHASSESFAVTHPTANVWNEVTNPELGVSAELSARSTPFYPPSNLIVHEDSRDSGFLDSENMGENVSPADRPICAFAAAGNCPRGERCPHIHGELCTSCEKYCLHPHRHDEREEHIKTCEKKKRQIEALKLSQEIECSVCLDRVLSKPTAAERKFGLLSECNHSFCISCIRNWRNNSPSSGMDINTALRACPICRKLSYFVIPSVIWYFTPEEKQDIVDSYKGKLRSINCRHFDFGSGSCPFGTSCFYKHAYRDGRLEEVVLRHLSAEDGDTVTAKDIRLSDFLANLRLR